MLTHWGPVTLYGIRNIGQHWFRYWLGTEKVPSHYLNQWWPSSPTHSCIASPQMSWKPPVHFQLNFTVECFAKCSPPSVSLSCGQPLWCSSGCPFIVGKATRLHQLVLTNTLIPCNLHRQTTFSFSRSFDRQKLDRDSTPEAKKAFYEKVFGSPVQKIEAINCIMYCGVLVKSYPWHIIISQIN